MFRVFSLVLVVASFTMATASERDCNELGLKQAFSPMWVQEVKACFLYTETDTQQMNQLSREPDGISVYSLSGSKKFTLVYDFPYAGTRAEIDDAFFISVDEYDEMLFVIHRVETPSSWDAVSDLYDVGVMKLKDGALVKDQALSRFFDLGGDLVDPQGKLSFIYPYKDKKSVENAVRSPLFRTVSSSSLIRGTINEKTFLYGGDAEPAVQDPSKKYLIKGDQVSVEDSVAGWCKVSYATNAKTISMWVQCKSIVFTNN